MQLSGNDNTQSYVSADYIIAKFLADTGHQDGDEFNRSNLLNWIGEALLHICSVRYPVEKFIQLEVENYQVDLPCDFYQLIQINYNGSPLAYNGSSYKFFDSSFKNPAQRSVDRYVFSIQNYTIHTNLQNGTLAMEYRALPMAESGDPLIPNSISTIEAITSYLKFRIYDAKMFRSKDKDSAQIRAMYRQEWKIQELQARVQGMMPSLEQMAHMKAMYNRMISTGTGFYSNFARIGSSDNNTRVR